MELEWKGRTVTACITEWASYLAYQYCCTKLQLIITTDCFFLSIFRHVMFLHYVQSVSYSLWQYIYIYSHGWYKDIRGSSLRLARREIYSLIRELASSHWFPVSPSLTVGSPFSEDVTEVGPRTRLNYHCFEGLMTSYWNGTVLFCNCMYGWKDCVTLIVLFCVLFANDSDVSTMLMIRCYI